MYEFGGGIGIASSAGSASSGSLSILSVNDDCSSLSWLLKLSSNNITNNNSGRIIFNTGSNMSARLPLVKFF